MKIKKTEILIIYEKTIEGDSIAVRGLFIYRNRPELIGIGGLDAKGY
ncbi:MAG: hypothetical protein BroJett041_18610 [Candidatus Jettenia caeni]|nr:MAG: hypothetical protein BroJett041_18610 [Candidatus Jettenia caeni]GJQ46290.1 MAG: hypothetical protein JETCAE04_20440 [Candidatus Jettenia caeni]